MRVAWFRLEDLRALIRARRLDDNVTRAVTRTLRAEPVVTYDDLLGRLNIDANSIGNLKSSTSSWNSILANWPWVERKLKLDELREVLPYVDGRLAGLVIERRPSEDRFALGGSDPATVGNTLIGIAPPTVMKNRG